MNKKLISLLLLSVLAVLALFCACGEKNPSKEPSGDAPNSQTPTEPAEPTEDPNRIIYQGEDCKVVRDGTPKKYFTLSIDDGTTQDLRIIEILKKYNMPCTFNLNTGILGASWDWVADATNTPGLKHLRFTEAELRTGIYDGFDVEVHTRNHLSLIEYNKTPNKIKSEIMDDAEAIYKITGKYPVGMAWPGGDPVYDNTTIKIAAEETTMGFGRGTTSTYKFKLPEYFLKWEPTCSFSDGSCLGLAKKFARAEATEDMVFYVWGHGYELDVFKSYDKFEELVKLMAEAEDVICVTNAEFYQLFKDEIPRIPADF